MSKIKLFDPYIDKSENIAVKRVLESHFWASGAGSGEVEKFENKFLKYINSKDMIRQSIPMMISSSVLLLMSWVDSLMIGSFIGEHEVGVYNVAVKVALLTSFTLRILTGSIYLSS